MANILVIDDSKVIRDMMQAILENNDHTVTVAKDGEEALGVAQKSVFNIIFSDINMPKMSGITLIGKIKETEKNKFTPIVMVTTENAEYRKQKARVSGAAGWLMKPVTEERILAAVKKLV